MYFLKVEKSNVKQPHLNKITNRRTKAPSIMVKTTQYFGSVFKVTADSV